ncbi:MAG: endonuclease/exonuclease/phosphatase family protein, partial [Hyphomicrobiales bacterium]
MVVTLNLWRMRGNWRLRRALVLAELRRIDPDVVALQEVAPFRWQARSLARALGGGGRYRAFVARKRGWRGLIEGIGLLTRLDAESYDARPLGGLRVAQRLAVRTAGKRPVTVFNAHMESGGAASEVRARQTAALVAAEAGPGTVVAGDFNASPGSRRLEPLAAAGFRSAYVAAHGAEPAWTAPAGPPGTAGSTL